MERFGGYFVVGREDGEGDSGEGARRGPLLSAVYAGVGLGARVDDVSGRLGSSERRVGASILFQGYAARIFSPLLGTVALDRPVPALPADEVRWTADGFSTASTATTDSSAEAITRVAVVEHFEPMIAALRKEVTVAEGLLWGNAASSLVGTLKVIANAGALDQRTLDVAVEVLAHPALRDAGDFTANTLGSFRRRSCCLYYRVPNGGLCGDCVLDKQSAR